MASPDTQTSRQDCLALDEADPLAPRRQMFQLPPASSISMVILWER